MTNGSERTEAKGGPGIALGAAAMGVAAILLVIAAKRPPESICDPMISLPVLAFAVAQAAFVLALGAFRRAGLGPLLAGVLPLAWALLAGAALALREAAGDFDAVTSGNLVMILGTVLGLFLLSHGIAMKLETAGSLGWLVGPVLALALSLAWLRVVEDGTPQRYWRSWGAADTWGLALGRMEKETGGVPRSDADLAAVIAALEPTFAKDLPRVDGWGRELEYVSDGKTWEIASLGAFGERGPEGTGPVRGFADDLVVSNLGYVSWPEQPCGGVDAAEIQELRTEPPPDGEPDKLPVPDGVIDKRNEKR